jgi:hypothetical protein
MWFQRHEHIFGTSPFFACAYPGSIFLNTTQEGCSWSKLLILLTNDDVTDRSRPVSKAQEKLAASKAKIEALLH